MNRNLLIGLVLVGTVGYGYVQDHPEVMNGITDKLGERVETVQADSNDDKNGKVTSRALDTDDAGVAGREDIIPVSAEDLMMNAAQDTAKQYLDQFLGVLDQDPDSYYLVKVAFQVNNAGQIGDEVIWVAQPTPNGDSEFIGTLSNDPQWMDGFEMGDAVTFTRDKIRDWAIEEQDGRAYGHFTTRVIADMVSEEDGEMIRQILKPDPLPPYFTPL